MPDRQDTSDDFIGSSKSGSWWRPIVTIGVVLASILVGIALFLPATRTARPAARRMQCLNNLRTIALALNQYAETYHALPPAHTVDASGRPLHSWRTLILPYLDHEELYESIDLTRPWNDPANAQAMATKLGVFACPEMAGPQNLTTYLAVVAPDSCWLADQPRSLAEITDAHGATLMLIEADVDHAIPWMEPVDADEALVLGLDSKVSLPHGGSMNAAFVDGSSRSLSANLPVEIRRALISIVGHDNNITIPE